MTGLIPGEDTISDFTCHIPDNLGSPVAHGCFGDVYRCTVRSSIGEMEVAVKIFRIDHRITMEKFTRAVHRELKVCRRLKHPNIVPLLGIAQVESPLPALVSRWMVSGTLFEYLEKQATIISPPARHDLIKGIAKGLDYLHTNNVIHGDFHPGNVLIDDSGSPCIADFGLATVSEDPELQWGTTTLGRNFNSRWFAPEVLGINDEPRSPTFKSDIYSFGSVMFFIISGDVPWKGKHPFQVCIELLKKVTPPRPPNISDSYWNLIQECWSSKPGNRPKAPIIPVLPVPESGGQIANIVIFGETGTGKSSVINLMAGQRIAKVSPDLDRCTMHWEEYRITIGETPYRVFDTVGLEPLDTKNYLSTIINAYDLITKLRENGGIHLLLFCIRGGKATAAMKPNYRLFFESLCDEKVPLALVVTKLEREKHMEDWYERNVGALEKFNIRSIGHACITAALPIDGRNKEKYEESKRIVSRIIQTHCNAVANGWTGGQGWFPSLTGKPMDFVTGRPKKTDIVGFLTKRCGMTKAKAQQLVRSINEN